MMRLYFCHRKGEQKGLYIIAPDADKACRMYSRSIRAPFRSIAASVAPIDIDTDETAGIVYPGGIIAQVYGIEYTDAERGRGQ